MVLLAHLEAKLWELEKWKFWEKNFFFKFFPKIRNFTFFTNFSPNLIFFMFSSIFELWWWPGYPNCSKWVALYTFGTHMVRFCILQALTAFEYFAWKIIFEKKAKFTIFIKFEVQLWLCSRPWFYSKFYFVAPPSAGEHF